MEVLTIVLASLLSIASGGGVIVDSIVANPIRSQVVSIEKQAIRVDNSPSYQIARGKLQKVRVATRGVTIEPNFRVQALELETDSLDIDLAKLDLDNIDKLRESLNKPLSGAVRLVLTQADLNRALQSPEILARIQKILNRAIAGRAGSTNISYQLQDIELQLQPTNRLGLEFKLSRPSSSFEYDRNSPSQTRELIMALELEIEVIQGRAIRILEPQGTVDGKPMSSRLLNGFAEGISDRLNFDSLEQDGILARILQLEIDEDKLELASFLKVETKTTQLSSKEIKVVP